MRVKDIMTPAVITVGTQATVSEIAKVLMDRKISALPVIDGDGKLCGIVSEGDLMRRINNQADDKRSWWQKMISSQSQDASEFIKSHGRTAREIMTRNVVTVEEDTEISEVARLLESHHIKRVPVTSNGRVVGIVSRSNLLQLVAGQKTKAKPDAGPGDLELRKQVYDVLSHLDFASHGTMNVIVVDGVVELWGWVESEAERDALLLAASEVKGVKNVRDHFGKVSPWLWGA
ncbi:MAG: CBS domain-containing protein [Rhodospirillales bacterium]|nr:CBS domain-containing protein [Rhodospirillales bacterium]